MIFYEIMSAIRILTICSSPSHLTTASCSSSRRSGGTVPISLVLLISNVRFKNRCKSNKCASSSVETSEKAVPWRPARAQRPIQYFTNLKKKKKLLLIHQKQKGLMIILTNSMNEQFWFTREMNIDYIVQTGNVNTSSSNIGYNEH